MSDLLNQASLVMIPSGYKEDIVYSPVPTNGNGDLSFTRASDGTRINSAGLVEVCPWNFIQYSEDFSNAAYTNIRMNVTTNSVANPINGTVNADKLIPSTDNGIHALRQTVTRETVFIYAKKGENDQIAFRDDGNTGKYASFNLTSGTIVDFSNSGGTQSITSVGNGWYLCQITFAIQGEYLLGVYFLSNSYTSGSPTSNTYAGNGTDGLYAWGYQANIGSTAKPYFPTTDRLNVPRLTYQNGGGGCPSLLLEKQSTNLITYSEQIQNAAWNVVGGDLVVTGNAVISPDGTQNAGAISLANSANRYFVHDPFSLTGGVAYTYSVYMKSASGNLSINMGGVNGLQGVLKTVTTEWQRFTYTFTPATTYAEYFGFDQRGAGSSTSGTLYFWGAQLEASSYPTSYIPTTSSSATRVADACFKTGISSLIGQTEGVLFVDITPQIFNNSSYQTVALIYPSYGLSGATYFHLYKNLGTTTLFFEVWNATSQCSLSYTMANNTRYKVAAGYKNNDFVLYVNGVQVGSDTSGTVASVSYSTLEMGYDSFNTNPQMSLSEFVLFPTRLTNAELASLTTI